MISSELLKEKSRNMMGKNKGNIRLDAKARMLDKNPMKDSFIAKKMGIARRKGIVSGKINAMANFNHLPTEYEKRLIKWFEEWNFPLRYVGDGQVNIDGYCPDFINENLKLILELELNFTHRPKTTKCLKEISYNKAGYEVIWITKMRKSYVYRWVSLYLQKMSVKPVKIKRIWKEKFHEGIHSRGREFVYNLEVSPNNTYIANSIIVHNCFANNFRASLYTAFFDNSKTMGLRHCNPSYYKAEMDKMAKYRAMSKEDKFNLKGITKAFALEIPLRMGIRFEDFTRSEEKYGISLQMLQYLRDIEYPVMINSKSDLPAQDAYVRAMADNKAKAAVHITMITSNEIIIKQLEPGAPSYARRLEALRRLNEAGVRAVPRIEPYLFLLTDRREDVEQYIQDIWDAGSRHITFDTYSYTANNSGIRQEFINEGYDYDRMFIAGADSQPLGSILLSKFMELFRDKGFSCSTFDLGNTPTNDQNICCEVEDWFDRGWNYGCTVMASRYISLQKGFPVRWRDFVQWVDKHGGFLTDEIKEEVHRLWNIEGNVAYSHRWAAGLVPCGLDEDGLIWRKEDSDYRKDLIKEIL